MFSEFVGLDFVYLFSVFLEEMYFLKEDVCFLKLRYKFLIGMLRKLIVVWKGKI